MSFSPESSCQRTFYSFKSNPHLMPYLSLLKSSGMVCKVDIVACYDAGRTGFVAAVCRQSLDVLFHDIILRFLIYILSESLNLILCGFQDSILINPPPYTENPNWKPPFSARRFQETIIYDIREIMTIVCHSLL